MRQLLPFTLCLCLGLAGCGVPSLLITPVQNANSFEEFQVEKGRGGKVVLIELEGMLVNAEAGGLFQPTENPLSNFVQQLKRAAEDDDVKAVVLRVNSPGGTVTTSDAMYEIVQRFRRETRKPVVASFQEVAASGGYYVSLASDRIVSQPTSVVGSIGVIFNTFDFEGTMNKIGARSEAIKSGPLKDMGSPFKALSSEERQVMQGMVDEYYQRFVSVVTEHRSIQDKETLRIVTDGRVFSGARAKELGLVDELGLLEDAIDTARKLAGAPDAKVVQYKRPFGYRGSIYASSQAPQAQVTKLELPGGPMLPSGFYYLWNP
jgi:protease-4